MNITESVEKQISAGNNKAEIIKNLQKEGFSNEEIEAATNHLGTIPSLENIDVEAKKAEPSIKGILIGLLFLVLGIARLSLDNFNNDGLGKFVGWMFIITGTIRIVMSAMGKK